LYIPPAVPMPPVLGSLESAAPKTAAGRACLSFRIHVFRAIAPVRDRVAAANERCGEIVHAVGADGDFSAVSVLVAHLADDPTAADEVAELRGSRRAAVPTAVPATACLPSFRGVDAVEANGGAVDDERITVDDVRTPGEARALRARSRGPGGRGQREEKHVWKRARQGVALDSGSARVQCSRLAVAAGELERPIRAKRTDPQAALIRANRVNPSVADAEKREHDHGHPGTAAVRSPTMRTPLAATDSFLKGVVNGALIGAVMWTGIVLVALEFLP
jgi:hypothetical protein